MPPSPAAPYAQFSEARVAFFAERYAAASDERMRAQLLFVIVRAGRAEAVPPLCRALKDPSAFVRRVAVQALAELVSPEASRCLRSTMEPDPDASALIEKILAMGANPPGASVLVSFVSQGTREISFEDRVLATRVLLEESENLEPTSQSPAGADARYLLWPELSVGENERLKLRVYAMKEEPPRHTLLLTLTVRASGANRSSGISVLARAAVAEIARELHFRSSTDGAPPPGAGAAEAPSAP